MKPDRWSRRSQDPRSRSGIPPKSFRLPCVSPAQERRSGIDSGPGLDVDHNLRLSSDSTRRRTAAQHGRSSNPNQDITIEGTLMAPLLIVDDLSLRLPAAGRLLREIGFELDAGEVVGLVGESGSGKTLTGLGILGLYPPGAEVAGRIVFDGDDLLRASPDRLRAVRGRDLSMIFQEPKSSLNPVLTIGRQISHVLRAHQRITRRQASARAVELLGRVGLPGPDRLLHAFPHELSGGMCQRVMIAMALACGPKLLIADEPTTALDVTIQAQIIELLRKLADEEGLSILLISHDLGVVADLCDRVVTMYAGEVVDIASRDDLLRRPTHPYSQNLLQATALEMRIDKSAPAREPALDREGCAYQPRCAYAVDRCRTTHPDLVFAGRSATRCLRSSELDLDGLVA
ncbi:ABC transporter ATP-binding protein [Nocardia gipuzkoensis]|uniref:ABC transporter ATP-binding protein n=1 Tax=Nocardia gipuzkoensis TaxID=2749991 RepID=UPI003EE30E1D